MKKDFKDFEKVLKKGAAQIYQPVSKETYDKYNVKKGLRYKDGTGVMAGLTSIGEVAGYYIDDGEKMPMHGHLRYRGYEISELVLLKRDAALKRLSIFFFSVSFPIKRHLKISHIISVSHVFCRTALQRI